MCFIMLACDAAVRQARCRCSAVACGSQYKHVTWPGYCVGRAISAPRPVAAGVCPACGFPDDMQEKRLRAMSLSDEGIKKSADSIIRDVFSPSRGNHLPAGLVLRRDGRLSFAGVRRSSGYFVILWHRLPRGAFRTEGFAGGAMMPGDGYFVKTDHMPKVALITGVTGQDGAYLAEFLLKKGYVVARCSTPTVSIIFTRIRIPRTGISYCTTATSPTV